MNYLKNFAVLVLAVLIVTACGGDYKTDSTGLKYKFHVKNDGPTPGVGDFITIDMQYGTPDTMLYDSKNIPGGLTFPLDSPYYEGDLFTGIMMMSKGDSASFLMSVDSFYLAIARARSLPPFVESGEIITFDVKLVDFKTPEEQQAAEAAELENRKVEAEAEFAKYLLDNNITTEPLESGLIFIEQKKGKGRTPKAEEMVTVNLTVTTLDGTKIFSTSDRGEPFEYEWGRNFDTKGLEEGVGMMSPGGKATLLVPSTIAYGAEARSQNIPPYANMYYEVELLKIRSKEVYNKEREQIQKEKQAEEDQRKLNEKSLRDKYISDNNIKVMPTASGLYYVEREKGTGNKAMPGNQVYVHYTGTLLDGTKFDSSLDRGEPFSFKLGTGAVIKGWDEAIAMMNEGGKATLVIPSEIAYGPRDRDKIPGYSTLIFEVELVKVEPTQTK